MKSPERALAVALAALGAFACPPECPPVQASFPATEATVPWLEATRPVVTVSQGTTSFTALMDTGFPRSLVSTSGSIPNPHGVLSVGGATVGPLNLDFSALPVPGADMVLGADVLDQLPLVFDARASATRIQTELGPGAGAAPLTRWTTGLCRGDNTQLGPEGPDLLLVSADLDGHPLTLLLDTGADFTFVRENAVPDLSSRPTLSNIPVQTRFSGDFLATATRARTLSIGGASSAGAPLLLAPGFESGLDGFLAGFRHQPVPIDGILGWSFLREFEVSLALGDDASTNRALGLTRFDTQTHWTRDFLGVGILTTQSASPEGLRITGFLSVSPAQEAGLQPGDVILTVNGAAAATVPLPWGRPGDPVQLQYQRGQTVLGATVTVADLLPDPPP